MEKGCLVCGAKRRRDSCFCPEHLAQWMKSGELSRVDRGGDLHRAMADFGNRVRAEAAK